jgi:hypothetical protein
MSMALDDLGPQAWAEAHFGDLELGHAKRNERAVTIAAGFAAHPGKSIPQTFGNWYQVQATYSFLANPEVTPDEVQARHRERTLEQLQAPGTYLLIEDTTEPSWGGRKPRPGLGPVGDGKSSKQGYQLHTTLAVHWPTAFDPEAFTAATQTRRPPVLVLGLADQQAHVRQAAPVGETRKERQGNCIKKSKLCPH